MTKSDKHVKNIIPGTVYKSRQHFRPEIMIDRANMVKAEWRQMDGFERYLESNIDRIDNG